METMDDFIRLIYVRLYGSRKKMRYRIEKAEGANKISGEFDFPDFAIIKRCQRIAEGEQNGFIKWHAAEGSG